jgi:hypothetical protein
MEDPCAIKLIKRCLVELKELTNILSSTLLLSRLHGQGYAEPFQQYAGNILSLLQPYDKAKKVKSLRREYSQVIRQAQVFDQLPKPLSGIASGKNGGEREESFELESGVRQSIDRFRYHCTDIVTKIEKGELKPDKPTETQQNGTAAQKCRVMNWLKSHPHSYGLQGGFIFLILFWVAGLIKPHWRNWCWGGAVVPFLVLILSLLGGRSHR